MEPPVASIPAAAIWRTKVPDWLRDRRAEVIAVLESPHYVVDEATF